MLFIDLNHFKHINDNFGHGVGDRVLVEVAERLRAAVRSRDMVARLSGDEFVVLLDHMDGRDGLERVRLQMEALLREPLASLGQHAPAWTEFGGSVGEAFYPEDGIEAEALLKKADRRMYKLKFQSRLGDPAQPQRRKSDPKG